MDSLDDLKQKIYDGSNVSGNKGKSNFLKKEASTKKYEKFLSESCFNDSG